MKKKTVKKTIEQNEGERSEPRVLILRTCKADMSSSYDKTFKWPKAGKVVCPDWDPTPKCGNGLYGHLWGGGWQCVLDFSPDSVWMVCAVDPDKIVDLDGKVKFSECEVVFCGSRIDATQYIYERAPRDVKVHGLMLTVGDNATVSGGYYATVSGGDYATVSGGDYATVSGGDNATVSGGYYATVSGGYYATVSGGDNATVSGGDNATVSGGYYATVSGGDNATVSGGYYATVSGGDYAIIQIKYLDNTASRYKIKTGYIGEDGLEPNVAYKLDANDNFVKA
jgi:hypothetical protein